MDRLPVRFVLFTDAGLIHSRSKIDPHQRANVYSSGGAGGIASRGIIYMGAPIDVLEIHLLAKLLAL